MPLTLPHTFGTAAPQPPEPMQFLDDNFAALAAFVNALTTGAPIPQVNAQTGVSYTIASTDLGNLVTFTNAGAIAVTLPQATGAFLAPWFCYVSCKTGSVGSVTITPSVSTIDGAATLVLNPGAGAMIVSDPSGNYQVEHFISPTVSARGTSNILNPYAINTTQSQTHGFVVAPTDAVIYLQNITAEHGYNPGDVVAALLDNFNVAADATSTYIVTSGTLPTLNDRATHAGFSITAANWKLIYIPILLS